MRHAVLAPRRFDAATHSRIAPMIQAARTIKVHWEGVLAWKKSSLNNGFLEGLNSLIQAATGSRPYG
jgi:transposase